MKLPELKEFFNRELPKEVRISECEFIQDVPKFVKSHISALENNKNKTFIPYYLRLIKLYNIINADTKPKIVPPKNQ
jgi:hypothetical protein